MIRVADEILREFWRTGIKVLREKIPKDSLV